MNCQILRPCYIDKFPVEILSRVFLLAVHDTTSESLQSAMIPHVLASVNLCWRTVALCTQRLWSSLVIDLHKVVRNRASGGLLPLATIIARSGRSSVDIIIRAQQGLMSGAEENV
jgi:hypothetical protein